MTRTLLSAIGIVALMACARSFVHDDTGAWGVSLAFGFLVLLAHQAARVFGALRLPHVTAYLATGFVCGPDVAGLVTKVMIERLALVNGIAVGLIALLAGSELCFKTLLPRLRTIVAIDLLALAVSTIACGALLWLLAPHLPFLVAMPPLQRLAAAATLGLVISSLSPSVALAITSEMRARGPAVETLLGVVVLADLLVIVGFAALHAFAAHAFGVGSPMNPAAQLAIELLGSAAAGVVMALLVALYVKRGLSHAPHFVLALCFVVSEIGPRLHLEGMVVCLTCGLLLRNVFDVSADTIRELLEPLTFPVFAIFFAMAGTHVHVGDLVALWPLVLALFVTRAACVTGVGWTVLRASGAPREIRRVVPSGMISQAGMSIGLAVLLARHFPSWGPAAQAVVLAIVSTNEVVGPVLLRRALAKEAPARVSLEPLPAIATSEARAE